MKVISFFSLSLIGLIALVSGLSAKHHESDGWSDFGAKLKQAVKEGKLSEEDAKALTQAILYSQAQIKAKRRKRV